MTTLNRRPLLIAYYPDFGRFFSFRKQSKLDEVAESLGMDYLFPTGGWFRAWRDRDLRGQPSFELADFDMMARGRKVVLAGYSDGAGLANYLASYRSEQVIAVVSYAGRLQRDSIETSHKFPVLDLWNEKDDRCCSAQHLHMQAMYEGQQHELKPEVIFNKRGHYRGWDSDANGSVVDFLRPAIAA